MNLTKECCLAFDWYSVNYDLDSVIVTILVPDSFTKGPYWEGHGNFRLLPRAGDGRTGQQVLDSIDRADSIKTEKAAAERK